MSPADEDRVRACNLLGVDPGATLSPSANLTLMKAIALTQIVTRAVSGRTTVAELAAAVTELEALAASHAPVAPDAPFTDARARIADRLRMIADRGEVQERTELVSLRAEVVKLKAELAAARLAQPAKAEPDKTPADASPEKPPLPELAQSQQPPEQHPFAVAAPSPWGTAVPTDLEQAFRASPGW